MSIRTPGDDVLCDHCDRLGVPYTYRGRIFSGLHANRGERLCSPCLDRACDTDGVDIAVTNRAGTHHFVVNTVRDRDVVFPANPEGIDGRDLFRKKGRARNA